MRTFINDLKKDIRKILKKNPKKESDSLEVVEEEKIQWDPNKPIMDIKDLRVSFQDPASGKMKNVIRGTGLSVKQNEVLGIVGESGAGKSVITTAALGMLPKAGKITGGTIELFGEDVTEYSQKDYVNKGILGKKLTCVFQNPLETLNPYQTISTQLIESAMLNDKTLTKGQARIKAVEVLKELKFHSPEVVLDSYPHHLSGGMRQRIVIASALLCKSQLIIMDEPTTALDPTIESEIMELILKLKSEHKKSIVLITHDLSIISMVADKIAVMYAGKVVEYGTAEEIINFPQHPYTWGLLRSVPDGKMDGKFYSIPGRPPYDISQVKGDAFAPRNIKYALEIDFDEEPPMFKVSDTHYAATWLLDDRAPYYEPPKVILERWNKFKAKYPKTIFPNLKKKEK